MVTTTRKVRHCLRKILMGAALLLLLSALLLGVAGCSSAGAEDDKGGSGGDVNESDNGDEGGGGQIGELTDESARERILFVYSTLNYYAMKSPNPEGSSRSFAGDAVTVTKNDSNNDFINAYYSDTVGVEFTSYSDSGDTINGSGTVVAFIDSYNGSEGAQYDGSFSGLYKGTAYTVDMDYQATNCAGLGIESSGTFLVNGNRLEVTADSDMIYDYSGI